MALTDTAVRQTKAGDKPLKLFDERGLYPDRNANRRQMVAVEVSLSGQREALVAGHLPRYATIGRARQKRDEARRLLASGIDPSAHRQAEKLERSADNSFEAVAREWITNRAAKWSRKQPRESAGPARACTSSSTSAHDRSDELTALDLLPVLRRVEAQGSHETAHKLREYCGQVFRYAIATGRAERDPAADLKGALKPIVVKHHAAVTDPRADRAAAPRSRGLRWLVYHALRVAPGATGIRAAGRAPDRGVVASSTSRAASGASAERMKMKAPHIVPLSKQAVDSPART